MQSFEDRYVIAHLGEVACACEAGRTCADDCDFLILPDHVSRELGLDAHFLCGVSDESFETSDGNRFALDASYALSLALSLLRAYTAADGRK